MANIVIRMAANAGEHRLLQNEPAIYEVHLSLLPPGSISNATRSEDHIGPGAVGYEAQAHHDLAIEQHRRKARKLQTCMVENLAGDQRLTSGAALSGGPSAQL